MTYLDSADLATLHVEFGRSPYAALDDTHRAAYLSVPEGTIANPVTVAPQVPAPVYESAFMGLLTDSSNNSVVKLATWSNFGLLKADIEASNRPGLGIWCQVLTKAGFMTAGEASAIIAYLSSTVADPNWSATVAAPTPIFRLFAGKTWIGSDGSSTNFPSMADIAAAR